MSEKHREVECETCYLHSEVMKNRDKNIAAIMRKVEANCTNIKSLEKEVIKMAGEIHEKINKKADSEKVEQELEGVRGRVSRLTSGISVSVFLATLTLVGSIWYFGHKMGGFEGTMHETVGKMTGAVNRRITECMERTNEKIASMGSKMTSIDEKIASINHDISNNSIHLEDVSQRLYSNSTKQSVLLEKIIKLEDKNK
jgi:gas vesicle protein